MSKDKAALRSASSALFGRQHLLEVVLAIASEEGAFFTKGLAGDHGLDKNQVHHEVQRLLTMGVLRRLPEVEGVVRAKYLERAPSAFWDFVVAYAEEVQQRQRGGDRISSS